MTVLRENFLVSICMCLYIMSACSTVHAPFPRVAVVSPLSPFPFHSASVSPLPCHPTLAVLPSPSSTCDDDTWRRQRQRWTQRDHRRTLHTQWVTTNVIQTDLQSNPTSKGTRGRDGGHGRVRWRCRECRRRAQRPRVTTTTTTNIDCYYVHYCKGRRLL